MRWLTNLLRGLPMPANASTRGVLAGSAHHRQGESQCGLIRCACCSGTHSRASCFCAGAAIALMWLRGGHRAPPGRSDQAAGSARTHAPTARQRTSRSPYEAAHPLHCLPASLCDLISVLVLSPRIDDESAERSQAVTGSSRDASDESGHEAPER